MCVCKPSEFSYSSGRSQCQNNKSDVGAAMQFLYDEAQRSGKAKAKLATIPKLAAYQFSTVINAVFMNMGVSAVAIPVFLLLAWKAYQRHRNNANSSTSQERRDWGALLPILNNVTLMTVLTASTFLLLVTPDRLERCVYTSGHWFTWTLTTLTFVLVLAHLYSYMNECSSSNFLFSVYVVWFAVYEFSAFQMLKRTQLYYHDALEASTGVQSAISYAAYFVLAIILQQYLISRHQDWPIEESEFRNSDSASNAPSDPPSYSEVGNNSSAPLYSSSVSSPAAAAAPAVPTVLAPSIPAAPIATPTVIPTAPAFVAAVPSAPPAPPAPGPPSIPSAPILRKTAAAPKPKPVSESAENKLFDEIRNSKFVLRRVGAPGSASKASGGAPLPASDSFIRGAMLHVRNFVQPPDDDDFELVEADS